MFPHSSIKRLRFAFLALAGLTLLALVVGCITFFYGYKTQERFLAEAAPLLVSVQQLSKGMVWFSATSRQLESINNLKGLNELLTNHRAQSDRLKAALLDLATRQPDEQTTEDLNETVHVLKTMELPYGVALRTGIKTTRRLAVLQRTIKDEGIAMLDRVGSFSLEATLRLIDFTEQRADDAGLEPEAMQSAITDVQLLTDVGIAVERFLHVLDGKEAALTISQAATHREAIALEFRRLTQLVLKLRDSRVRQTLAASLRVFNENVLEKGGIVDQWRRRADAVVYVEGLSQQRVALLARMTNLVNGIVVKAREGFYGSAKTAQRSSLIAVSTLAILSIITFFAVIWIGLRLINRDIAQRLERLAASTIALADGHLEVRIDQAGSDELADMARATEIFRQNALELRRTEAELADRLIEVEGANDKLQIVNTALDAVNAELAESELRYELAVRGSSAGIWDLNVKTNTLFWSPRMKEIVGLTNQAFKPDMSAFIDRLHPDDHDRVMEQRRRHVTDGEDYNVECRLRREDGSYVWVHNRGQAIFDDDGQVVRMAGSATDISDRKSAEIQLTSYARELERSNRELDDFAYIASHDLREPLRAMYNHATFLIEDFQGKLGEDGEKRLHRMIKLGKRMEKLIADLLYFSRLGRGEQAVERIDLNGVIADIEANLAETLKARNARILVPEHLPSINGHPAQMITLLQNLIVNGVKYNDAAEKIIEIGLIPTSGESDMPGFETFYVRDNGIGIETQFVDEVFRIFKRLNSEKTYGEGTGAGLTFVKKIVENHGGTIWIESEPGKGTTFFLTLPIRVGSSAAAVDHAAA